MVFADQIGRTMEVYINDMLVKSLEAEDHISHLQQAFSTLQKYNMKLNPAKCSFGAVLANSLGTLKPTGASKPTEANQGHSFNPFPEERQRSPKADRKNGGLEQIHLQTLRQISYLLRNPQKSKRLPVDGRVRIRSP